LQGHRVTVAVRGLPQQGGGRHGRVSGFSPSSRKRLLDLLASVDPKPIKGSRNVGLFITLTYAGEESALPLK